MSFSADWLALRADADREARDTGLSGELAGLIEDLPSLRVLDLGAGTGANMAALSPVLSAEQHWVLVDSDAALLEQVEPPLGITVTRRSCDLAEDLAPLFDPVPDLVTASAFFDLCGAAWITRLADAVADAGALFYTGLTYDGRENWTPAHPLDAQVLAAFHEDQRRDKGLGPALGPGATTALAEALGARGYEVLTASSDWELNSADHADLIAALAEGSAAAVRPALGDQAQTWCDARRTAATVLIGHQDLLAIPPGWET